MTTKCRIKPFLDHLHGEILVTVIQPFNLTKFSTMTHSLKMLPIPHYFFTKREYSAANYFNKLRSDQQNGNLERLVLATTKISLKQL